MNKPDLKYWKVGDFPNEQTQRTDDAHEKEEKRNQKFAEMLKNFNSIDEFIDKMPLTYCRNRNGIRDFFAKVKKDTQTKIPPTVIWLCGKTGCGKSRLAEQFALAYAQLKGRNGEKPWRNFDNLKWFDGFVQQLVAIIEDFRKDHVDFAYFLRILDRYELNCQVKNTPEGTFWNPEVIIITCPRTP